jgi:hypothetical protein
MPGDAISARLLPIDIERQHHRRDNAKRIAFGSRKERRLKPLVEMRVRVL